MCVPKQDINLISLALEKTYLGHDAILSSFDHQRMRLFFGFQCQVIKYKVKLHRISYITEMHVAESAGYSKSLK